MGARTTDSLNVFVNDVLVGALTRDGEGFYDFLYRDGVPSDLAVSLSMPVDNDPNRYSEFGVVPAPFRVSLPEGAVLEKLRSLYKKDFNIDDAFDLLRSAGICCSICGWDGKNCSNAGLCDGRVESWDDSH